MLTETGVKATPAVGDLMAGSKAGALYRIVGVTKLRRAGMDQFRYRLRCCLTTSDARADTTHPWRLAETPRLAVTPAAMTELWSHGSPLLAQMGIRDRWMLQRIQFSAPLLLALGLDAIPRARVEGLRAEQARAARVGRDPLGGAEGADYGHTIRQQEIVTEAGVVLREVDVEIDRDASDAATPNMRIRRARRADPLHGLLKRESITPRQFDAAEALRSDIEAGMPELGGAAQSEIHKAPWDRAVMNDRLVEACAAVRAAISEVKSADRLVLAWMIGGGTLVGFVRFAQVHSKTAARRLKAALDVVADHYLGSE